MLSDEALTLLRTTRRLYIEAGPTGWRPNAAGCIHTRMCQANAQLGKHWLTPIPILAQITTAWREVNPEPMMYTSDVLGYEACVAALDRTLLHAESALIDEPVVGLA